jgi:outer membrane protein assembly factor BamD
MTKSLFRLVSGLILIISAGLLGACSSADPYADLQGLSAEQLFANGEQALAKKRFRQAVRFYEYLEATYPFSAYAEQAHRNLIYSYYENREPTAAASSAERFIRLYPTSQYVDYAYYMKGVANFEYDRGILFRAAPLDVSKRDMSGQLQAYRDFVALIQRFPNSKYAPAARQYLIYIRNLLAKRELEIGEMYYGQELYVAAANRASYVVENYSQAPETEEALVLLVKANRKLGLTTAADEAYAMLQRNYPNSKELNRLKHSRRANAS